MNHGVERSGLRSQATDVAPPRRGRAVALFITLGVLVFGLVAGNALLQKHRPTFSVNQPSPAGDQSSKPATLADPRPHTNPELVARVARNSAPEGQPDSSIAQQLIGQLTQLQVAGGKLTEEQAGQIQQSFQQLVAQGSAAIPAIREFLEKSQDWSFGRWPAGTPGAPSVRTGLLDALAQIGGPEAMALSQHVLQSTADPLEIALLARNLEQAAPGQYSQQAVEAATAALDQAANGTLTNVDVGPLFQVLQNYGGADAAAIRRTKIKK